MKLTRPDLAAYAVVALCVVGIAVLTALRLPVPDFLTFAGTTALGIGGGVSLQGITGPTQEILPSGAARAAAPAGNPPVFAPTPLAADPPTGVFRIASHDPR